MKVLISGGLGFQGLPLVKFLLDEKIFVNNINIDTPANREKALSINNKNLESFWVENEINAKSLMNPIQDCSHFIHFANGIRLDDSQRKKDIPNELLKKNLQNYSFEQLLNITQDEEIINDFEKEQGIIKVLMNSSLKRILFISSASVYGACSSNPIKESDSLIPEKYYGLMKVILEKLYTSSFNDDPDRLTLIRPFNLYGPLQEPNKSGAFLVKTIDNALQKKNIVINGDGAQLRDPLYIDDLTRCYYEILQSKLTPGIINVGSGIPISINRIVELVKRHTKSNSEIIHPKPSDIQSSNYADITLLKKMEFKPSVTVEQGIKKIISHWNK